uniref:Protein kinase domain-containing protein n=1 Tax=Meloidogyne floridensis TaxID=298350 RepID=A0A915NDG8_9BILA
MKILTSKLILPLLFLLALNLKGLNAGNTCRKQNSAAGGSQRLNKGKKPMKAKEEIAGASSSHLAADTTTKCYCGKKTTVEKVSFKLKKDKEFNSTELLLVKPPIYNGKEGQVKIYHAIWPKKERCVAIKFLIKNSDETKEAVRKEIAVLEHFYGPGENKNINEPIRIVEYFGHEEKTIQIGNHSLEVESIVLELGKMNLLKYYNKSKKGQKNIAKHLTQILISAAEALKQLHDENIAHLDIKPENFVSTNVSDQSFLPVFKLIDFGTCEFMENSEIKSISKEILGTDVYIAPEIDRSEKYKKLMENA